MRPHSHSATGMVNVLLSGELRPSKERTSVNVLNDQCFNEERSDAMNQEITEVFGDRIAAMVFCPSWAIRIDGYSAIKQALKEMQSGYIEPSAIFLKTVCYTLSSGIRDPVPPVVYSALDCLGAAMQAFKPFIDNSYTMNQPLASTLSLLILRLMIKLAERNVKARKQVEASLVSVVTLHQLNPLKHVSLHLCLEQVPLKGRIRAVNALVTSFGLNQANCLTLHDVIKVIRPGLNSNDIKVRKASINLVVLASEFVGHEAVFLQLPDLKPLKRKALKKRLESKIASNSRKGRSIASKVAAPEASDNHKEETYNDEHPQLHCIVKDAEADAESLLGPVLWRNLHGEWRDRVGGTSELVKLLRCQKQQIRHAIPSSGSTHQRHFAAYCTISHLLMNDVVVPVVISAITAFSTLISVYCTSVQYSEERVKVLLTRCIKTLLSKASMSNRRVHALAFSTVLKFARLKDRLGLEYTLNSLFSRSTPSSIRMEVLRVVVTEFGLSCGVSAKLLVPAIAEALGAKEENTRRLGIDVAVALNFHIGSERTLSYFSSCQPSILLKIVESGKKEKSSRPQTVKQLENDDRACLGHESMRFRKLTSAPVGSGPLRYEPLKCNTKADDILIEETPANLFSQDEEALMNALVQVNLST